MSGRPLSASGTDGSVAVSRVARLDALRALTAILVMAHHVIASGTWDMWPVTAVMAQGHRGILVFFVLSGFLLFRPFVVGPVDTGGYLLRRVARVMPAYVLALIGISILSGDRTFADNPAQFLLFLQNYDPRLLQTFIPATWTLVLEMTYYAVLPVLAVLLLAVARRRTSRGLALLGILAVCSWVAHISLATLSDPMTSFIAKLSFPAMLWAFVPGMLVAWLTVARPAIAGRLADGRVALLAMLLVAWGWMDGGSLLAGSRAEACLVTGIALMIPWLTRPRTQGETRPVVALAWFGVVVSYPFYLWHMAVIDAGRGLGLSGPAGTAVLFAITVGIGVVSYRAVELPAMRWARSPTRILRRLRRPSPTTQPGPATPTSQ